MQDWCAGAALRESGPSEAVTLACASGAGGRMDVDRHLEELDEQGYTVIPDFLSADAIVRVREGLAPYLGTHAGRNGFEGFRTERVYTLVGRGRTFEAITEDPRVLALLDRILRPGYLLTASQASCLPPCARAQPTHHAATFSPCPRPRRSTSMSTSVPVDAFTAENGGTEVVPGSHRWSDTE